MCNTKDGKIPVCKGTSGLALVSYRNNSEFAILQQVLECLFYKVELSNNPLGRLILYNVIKVYCGKRRLLELIVFFSLYPSISCDKIDCQHYRLSLLHCDSVHTQALSAITEFQGTHPQSGDSVSEEFVSYKDQVLSFST